MTPAQAAAKFGRVAANLENAVADAEAETLRDARKAAAAQSSGPYSQKQLNRLGNPYARSGPQASFDPAIINQGGPNRQFAKDWHTAGPARQMGGLVSRMWNSDPNVKYLLGMRRTVDRPVRDAILKAVLPRRVKRLQAAVTKALK